MKQHTEAGYARLESGVTGGSVSQKERANQVQGRQSWKDHCKTSISIFPSEASHLEQHRKRSSSYCLWPMAGSAVPSADPHSCVGALKVSSHPSMPTACSDFSTAAGQSEMQGLLGSATLQLEPKPKPQDTGAQLTIAFVSWISVKKLFPRIKLESWQRKKQTVCPKVGSCDQQQVVRDTGQQTCARGLPEELPVQPS